MKIFHGLLSLGLFLFVTVSSFADPIHADEDLDRIIQEANHKFLNAEFDEGISMIKEAAETRPASPAVSYFLTNGYWWKIFRAYIYDKEAKTTEWDDEFDDYLQQTIDRSELLLKRNPHDVVGLFYLGNAYSLKSRLKGLRGSYFSAGRDAGKGKKYLEQVIEAEPTQHDAFYNLGMYNYLAGTLPGYAKVLKTLLFLPGGDKEKGLTLLKIAGQKSTYFGDESQLLLARFYADFEEQPADALRIVQSFRTRFPGNAWFHYWTGTLLSDELNDYAQAEQIYTEIISLCDRNAATYSAELKNQAWLKLARVHGKLLYPEKAIDEIKTLIAAKPKEPTWILARAHLELGNLYDQIGMRREATLAYKQVLSMRNYRDFHNQAEKLLEQNYNQKNADIYRMNLDGRRLTAEGKFDEAEASLRKVLEKYPNNDQTLYALADMYYKKGSYKESGELLNTILGRNPKEPKWLIPGVYVRLGMVYEARKQADAARRLYEKALDTDFIASDDRNMARRALKQMAQHKNS